MAKKSAAPRQTKAAQRPTSAAKPATVRLVRPEGSSSATDSRSGQNTSGAQLVRPGAATATVERAAPQRSTITRGTSATSTRPAPGPVAPAAPKAPTATPIAKAIAAAPTATAPKATPAVPKATPTAPKSTAPAKVAESRIQRAAAVRARRTESLVTPEHYSYVLKDLRLTFALALAFLVVLIALHFALPS